MSIAHDVSVRTMVWSHNDSWMVTGDHSGYVKYWQSNMNNVKMFQAHKEPIRGISFSPTDSKFVSCSDDGTLRIWDFYRCMEEKVLRGHGADVKCVHWHPHKGLVISGSKDNQQSIKLWDPKSGTSLATLYAHKSTVMDLKWNDNGNWLVTASRDHLIKLFDLRNLKEEMQIFRGHKKEASSVSWHPVHEGLFCSGGSDGSILFWNVGTDKEIGCIETAHDSIVWTLAWHPLGHILCSGSNDHTIKFWTRNRPGDMMRDKYNLNTLPASLAALDECEYDDAIIPGMGPEDKVEFTESLTADKGFIPGLDLDPSKIPLDKDREKKVPYSKPIPRNFQAQWAGSRRNDDMNANDDHVGSSNRSEGRDLNGLSQQQLSESIIEGMLASGTLNTIDQQAIVGILVYGRFIRVHPDSRLMIAIRQGSEYLNKYIDAGKLDELRDVVPARERSRSHTPTLEARETSPPQKRSRFEPRQHNAQVVFAWELQSLKKPFLPCLLTMKGQQHLIPNDMVAERGRSPIRSERDLDIKNNRHLGMEREQRDNANRDRDGNRERARDRKRVNNNGDGVSAGRQRERDRNRGERRDERDRDRERDRERERERDRDLPNIWAVNWQSQSQQQQQQQQQQQVNPWAGNGPFNNNNNNNGNNSNNMNNMMDSNGFNGNSNGPFAPTTAMGGNMNPFNNNNNNNNNNIGNNSSNIVFVIDDNESEDGFNARTERNQKSTQRQGGNNRRNRRGGNAAGGGGGGRQRGRNNRRF